MNIAVRRMNVARAPDVFELTMVADRLDLRRLETALAYWRDHGAPCPPGALCAACQLLAEVGHLLAVWP